MRSHSSAVARSSHGRSTPRAISTAAIGPAAMTEAPGWTSHHGARGQPSIDGSTNTVPPSGGSVRSSQSHARVTSASSQAPASSSVRRANDTVAGWLPGLRQSGSSAWPKPPSGLA